MRFTFLCILLIGFCTACQAAAPLPTASPAAEMTSPVPAATQTPLPGPWQVFGEFNEHHSIMTAGFHDESFAITGGVIGYMFYSTDGGETWHEGVNQSDCRYGMEIVSRDAAWTCGGMTHVRRSVDGGRTWQEVANFGDASLSNPCHSLSFLDENTGWLAASTLFGSTDDGGATWFLPPLPEGSIDIATIDTYLPGEGYLLDEAGKLYFTQDNGVHWVLTAELPIGDLKIPISPYQWAAMRFSDAEHGMIVWSAEAQQKVVAFHTSNGGQSWTSEPVPVFSGPVYLSRDARLLTVIKGANIFAVMVYRGE
jgi:photosystem II stability/assembly factor-like uncharacterized protein